MGEYSRFLQTSRTVIAIKPRIYQTKGLSLLGQVRPSPLHQILLPAWPVLVHRLPPGQHFQQHDAE